MMLLEVASLGVPTLCSDIPENTAVLVDKALYFKSGDAGALETKLRWALANPQQMGELGSAAQQLVRQHNSWDTITTQYRDLYQGMIADKGAHNSASAKAS